MKIEIPTWFSIDKICVVVAIINVIANLLIVVGCSNIWYMVFLLDIGADLLFGPPGHLLFNTQLFLMVLMPLFAVLNIIFLVFLINGIWETRPKPVKAYFFFSVVVTILVAMISVILLICISQATNSDPKDSDSKVSLVGSFKSNWNDPLIRLPYKTLVGYLVGCVLHIGFLVVVHLTHRKLVNDERAADNARLLEISDLGNRNQEHY